MRAHKRASADVRQSRLPRMSFEFMHKIRPEDCMSVDKSSCATL